MPVTANVWWTKEKVAATVTRPYIYAQLQPNEQEYLQKKPHYPSAQHDETYLNRTLTHAKRFFLILAATGVPDQIFGVIDDGFEDDHLPIAEDKVSKLRLSLKPDRSLDRRFYKTQFRFLARDIEEGEYIHYADDETVPVTPLGIKSVVTVGRDGLDTVRLLNEPGTMLTRKRVKVNPTAVEGGMLAEIVSMTRFSHEHIESVFSSYYHTDSLHILLKPAFEWTLRSFLTDQPKAFDSLFKSDRRQILINWPHCLANALAWLHANESHHGAIRPSNIYVTHDFRVVMGLMEGEGILCISSKPDDIEAYQYAAPERWKRAVTVQNNALRGRSLSTRGRASKTANQPDSTHANDPSLRKRSGSSLGTHSTDPDTKSHAFNPISKSDFARFKLSNISNFTSDINASHNESQRTGPSESTPSHSRSHTGTSNERSTRTQPSSAFSDSSGGKEKLSFALNQGLFAAAPEFRTAVVQTWKSVEHDSFAADVFSLGAISLDILTVLCKKTFSSFVRHRAAKNRNAGRGGGIADASFHANLGQVESWAASVSDEGEKKARKDDSQALRAIKPMVEIILQCVEKNPGARLSSGTLEAELERCITKHAKIDNLHCKLQRPQGQNLNLAFRERLLQDYGVSQAPLLQQQQTVHRNQPTPLPQAYPDIYATNQPPDVRARHDRTFASPFMSPATQQMPTRNLGKDRSLNSNIGSPAMTFRSGPYPDSQFEETNEEYGWPPTSDMPRPVAQGQSRQYNPDPRESRNRINNPTAVSHTAAYMNYSTSTSGNEEEEEPTVYAYPMPPAVRSPRRNSLQNRYAQQVSYPHMLQSQVEQGVSTSTAGYPHLSSPVPLITHEQKRQLVSPSPNQATARARPMSQDIFMRRQQQLHNRDVSHTSQQTPQSRLQTIRQEQLEEFDEGEEEEEEHGHGRGHIYGNGHGHEREQGRQQQGQRQEGTQEDDQVQQHDYANNQSSHSERIINLDFGPARSQAGQDYERMYRI